mmetsp:Transcript_19385/g.25013  ORF Transcript_19385/g.25013 Transcript_19385/m.25013 type:complete len:97 (+) Transcript_19385:1273-1563(+)
MFFSPYIKNLSQISTSWDLVEMAWVQEEMILRKAMKLVGQNKKMGAAVDLVSTNFVILFHATKHWHWIMQTFVDHKSCQSCPIEISIIIIIIKIKK